MHPVSPAEGNLSILKRDQAIVGNGNTMSVAAEIFDYVFRTSEWAFAVNNPLVPVDVTNEGMKRLRIRKMLQLSVKTDSEDPQEPSSDDQKTNHRQGLHSEHVGDVPFSASRYGVR